MVGSMNGKVSDLVVLPSSEAKTWDSSERTTAGNNNFWSLNWNNWKLCGREEQIEQLEECYLARKDSDLVIVTGSMGSGKTALTESLQSRVRDDDGILARGSFPKSQSRPYAAFVAAFTDLVKQLQLKRDHAIIKADVKRAIVQSGAEKFLISDGLSVLKNFMNDEIISDVLLDRVDIKNEVQQQQKRRQQISPADRQQRFVNAVTKIVEAIGSVLPLVLVLDNIMWADSGSLHLLESLCIAGKLSNVLLVATCRDDVGFHDPLSVKLRTMEDRGLRLTDIHVPPLSVGHIHDFILTLVGEDCSEKSYREPARLIHDCTSGNPLLVCELLGIIEKEGLNSKMLRERLHYEDFVNAKVSEIPSSRRVLQVIACLGEHMVHESVLKELLQESESDIRNELMAAQEQGILTVTSESGECNFVHENFQAAIYHLIPVEERCSIHYEIAERLSAWLTAEHIEENLFLLVDQYLKGNDRIPKDKTEKVAFLCLQAARKAAFSSAFTSAEHFIQFGSSLLIPRTKWRDTYSLTLNLMNAAIELEFCHGNHDSVDRLHEEISFHSRTAMDSVTSYTIHINSLGSRGRLQEAIAESMQILDNLGERMPRRFLVLRTITGLLEMKKILKETPEVEILSLPPLNNAKIQAVMNILHLMFVYSFMSQSGLVPVVSMRTIELTLRYGLNPMSATSFAIFGMVEMMALGNHEEGYRFGRLALALIDTINCREMMARTYNAVYGFLSSYKEPLRDSIQPLIEAYRLNILTGDVEMAIASKSISQGNALLAGIPLFQCISGMREVLDACELHNQDWNQRIIRISAQFTVNLSGCGGPSSPFDLTGEFMIEKNVEADILREKNDIQLTWMYFLKFMMAVYLCEVTIAVKAEALIKPLKKHLKNAGCYNRQTQVFHEGMLSCFLAAAAGREHQRRGKALFARAGRRLKTIQHYASICPANYQNKALLLEAEMESIKKEKSPSDIIFLYHKAAKIASEGGFLHEQALALEKGGRYLLKESNELQNKSEARSFFIDAIEVYKEHGSMLKVDQLEQLLDR